MNDEQFSYSINPIVYEAQNLVRETAYNACCVKDLGEGSESLSRAFALYKSAVELLYLLDPQGAETFVSKTYQPLDEPFRPKPVLTVGARVKVLHADWKEGTIVAANDDFSRFQVKWDTIHLSDGTVWTDGKKTWYKKERLAPLPIASAR